jgi:two-component system, cell cycle sensor histidine kinase and response regulator CckA
VNKPRVLVVEDSPVISEMIQHYLKKCDYVVAGAVTTGEAAVEIAAELEPDLVLMDIELAAEMDGTQAAGLIWDRFHIPVVYLTANDDVETISRASSTSSYGYLLKPVQERELYSAVQIALSKHASDCRAREQDNWLRTTLLCIADAVIAADSVGFVKLVNPAAEALIGWSQEEAMGRDIVELFQMLECGTRRPTECAVVEAIRDVGVSRSIRARILIARDGSEKAVEETAAPIVNDSGYIVGVVLVIRKTAL